MSPSRVFNEAEKQELERRMLEMAVPLLEKYGMTHMSVDKITSAVGIGKSTFYNFFSSKEEYVNRALDMNRMLILRQLDEKYPADRKMKPRELFEFLNNILGSDSIYRKFAPEDERKLYEADKAIGKDLDLEREKMISRFIFSHVEGVKSEEELDYALITNLVKLTQIAYENEYLFHDSAMERMQTTLKKKLCEICIKDEYQDEVMNYLDEYEKEITDKKKGE